MVVSFFIFCIRNASPTWPTPTTSGRDSTFRSVVVITGAALDVVDEALGFTVGITEGFGVVVVAEYLYFGNVDVLYLDAVLVLVLPLIFTSSVMDIVGSSVVGTGRIICLWDCVVILDKTEGISGSSDVIGVAEVVGVCVDTVDVVLAVLPACLLIRPRFLRR